LSDARIWRHGPDRVVDMAMASLFPRPVADVRVMRRVDRDLQGA